VRGKRLPEPATHRSSHLECCGETRDSREPGWHPVCVLTDLPPRVEAVMTTDDAAAGVSARIGDRPWARQQDRRNGIGTLLAALAQGLCDDHAAEVLRRHFEASLCQIVPVRSVRLCEVAPHAPVRVSKSQSMIESVSLDIPMKGHGRRALLEATFDRGVGLDPWDLQMLGAAAHLASFVLAVEESAALNRHDHSRGRSAVDGAGPLIGSSAAMQALRERIERLALTDFTVLIEGESGTGKELVARQIHDLSRRSKGPFVAINCAALVETLVEAELFGIEERTATGVKGRRGKFEHAQGGTLFLDEVSDLSLAAQAKLLRAIQDLAVERVGGHGSRRVDIRILVATNRRLGDLVDRGLFRQDLYDRLSGVELNVPALRTRREDVPELADYFLSRYRNVRPLTFSGAAHDVLRLYEWPGNVRELERLVEGVVALARSDRIEVDDLPSPVRGKYVEVLQPSIALGESLRAFGSRYARLVLARCGQNKRRACQLLGISYHTLQAYLDFQPWDPCRRAVGGDWRTVEVCHDPTADEATHAAGATEHADPTTTTCTR
jgi:DNA-binding NtrC family response regulator